MKTFSAKAHEVVHDWYLVDATDKVLGRLASEIAHRLRGRVDLAFSDPANAPLNQCDVVFFATPHGVAMEQARDLLAKGVKVIDLAADFRLQDPAEFERWYRMPHGCTDLLAQAVYGLPEINRDQVRSARLIGLPGCYPTSVQLGYLPVLEQEGLVDPSTLIADCKSGVSGAGRKAEVGTLFSESSDNFKAYGVDGHRHWPEITQGLKAIMGGGDWSTSKIDSLKFAFIPHLTPMIRGIHSTLYARLTPKGQAADIQGLYEQRFANEPFVDVLPAGAAPETRSVRASNYVRIAVHKPPVTHGQDQDLLCILVVEDNLVKGASGQAVQVMNLLFNLPETAGLTLVPVLP
jgi:N-acetyl-gamma-glutamyl-phosphate reductase